MNRLATSALVGLAGLSALAQTTPSRPRIVVGIVVDQLRTDYVEYLRDWMGDDGFRRLMRDGAYIRDVDFGVSGLDAASATAMLYTGAYPSTTGIPSSMVFDYDANVSRPALAATNGGSLTNDSFTPEGLRLTTVADEIAVDGDGKSLIYSVAFDPQQAVTLSGHAGTSALWVNNTSGNWATTSWYGALPQQASVRNFRGSLAERIDTMTWRPSARLRDIPGIPFSKKSNPFKYTFPRSDRDVFIRLSSTPMANAEVTNLAIELLRDLSNRQDKEAVGMINVAYTAAPYKNATGNGRAELTDAYLRLDSQLGRLLEAVDRYFGPGNALIWLSSTGYCDEATAEEKRYRLPSGDFSTSKAKSLLNSFLSARYGSAQYVSAIRNGQVYLDRKTLEAKHLDTSEVTDEARGFIVRMAGIEEAYTLSQILSPATEEERALSRRADPRYTGDILLVFTPGWTVTEDEQYPPVSRQSRQAAVMTPAFIAGPGVKAEVIRTPVDATALAPSITGLLRIRAPSGTRARSIF